ncbi:MAG: bifunctional glutamate N-acetyltransferase/amino-acid acetyltransferase ArgJ [Gammaproteobacteria bacterium]|nr:bifunctional glutamate N-acetyltransferase/amino-acid acetyltransferase ArgJ [Gammaproteobacteria bacterium]
MTVNLNEATHLAAVKGIRLAAGASGIKKNNTIDLVLIEISEGASCAAVFTQNRFRAAPVIIAEQHLSESSPRLLLINSGNANAGTGESGYRNALLTCELAADVLGCKKQQVLPFSTGVIGENLQVDCFEKSLPELVSQLGSDNWLMAAKGIMTTDTVPKGITREIQIDEETITITGIAKGSGMIKPNMATMLSYIATDAKISADLLTECLKTSVEYSFNSITVDGDTSTNDSCVLLATGQTDAAEIKKSSAGFSVFMQALAEVMQTLAQSIIRDAEGITKFVEITVCNAVSYDDAKTVAYTVAHSPLVKTALFASDPNWGRILAAVGRAEIDKIEVDQLSIYLDDVCIVEEGARAGSYTEAAGQRVMNESEIKITIDLAMGDCQATVWTSDLSYDYVKINAEYRS